MGNFVDKHHIWLNPLLIFLTTVSSAFLSIQPSQAFQKAHPVKTAVYTAYLKYNIFVFILCAILLLVITVINSRNNKTIKNLKRKLNRSERINGKISENTKELFSGYFYKLSNSKLSFTSNERITIYIHNGKDFFVPFARYSSNTKYGKPGRDLYPDNIGCISKGWENQWHFKIFENDDDFSKQNAEKYGMNEDVIDTLNMPSRLFAVVRIDSTDGKPIGIIVVESTDKEKYTERQIKSILKEHKEYVAEMIVTFGEFIPNPSLAATIEEV